MKPKIKFAKKIAALGLNDHETALFVAVIILSPGNLYLSLSRLIDVSCADAFLFRSTWSD